ncbi:transposase [Salipiger aestuarii]|uniref:transposase n=1 Tax=Salipiger aestuarii TaxID=568098 RepID=UPI001CC2C7AD|nr:transposase [Salipiger aestuarii]
MQLLPKTECRNEHLFMSLADARENLGDWRRHYHKDRPHSATGYNVPITMYYPDGAASASP